MDEQQEFLIEPEEQSLGTNETARALQLKVFAMGLGADVLIDLIAHGGWSGLVFGGALAALLAKQSPVFAEPLRELNPFERISWGGRTLADRALGRYPDQEEDDVPSPQEAYERVEPTEDTQQESDLSEFLEEWKQAQTAALPPIPRVTIEAIIEHTQRNSYWIYVGRNLSDPKHQVEVLNFCRQHIKIIGQSQKGKSSMAAALMEIITRTHDPSHVQIALLDLEHKTSRLFEDLPHVASWQGRRLLATSEEEVIEHLGYLYEMLQYRYTLSEAELEGLPYLLIYVEEFLDLKNTLKTTIEASPRGAKKEAAAEAYAQLVIAINKIALRGLKVHMQFLLCAQVTYTDKSFREALGQFGIGFSFCVNPPAAVAAGFTNYQLLQENEAANQAGQAVMEANGRRAIILAPEYNLRQRLIAHGKRFGHTRRRDGHETAETPLPESLERPFSERLDARLLSTSERKEMLEASVQTDVQTLVETQKTPLAEPADAATEERLSKYRLSERDIQQFISAYRASGSIDKALGTIKKGTSYRAHAREIVQALGLKQV